MAMRSLELKSSISSITRSDDISRNEGKIYLPPRVVSTAPIIWSIVAARTGLYRKALFFFDVFSFTATPFLSVLLKKISRNRDCSSFSVSTYSNSSGSSGSSDKYSFLFPSFFLSSSLFSSCNLATALEPIRTARSFLSRWIRSLYSSPVCSVSVRRPRARIYRSDFPSADTACMIFALANVLPQPVLAILTIKYLPSSPFFSRNALIFSTAISCHLKTAGLFFVNAFTS